MKKKIFLFSVLVFFSALAFAEYNSFEIPDSAEIRKTLINTWFESPIAAVRDFKEEFKTNKIGESFQIRLEETETDFAIVVAPRSELNIDLVNGDNHKIVRAEVYPKGAAGSWILFREKKSGLPKRIEYHFNQDADVFLQFRPSGNKTLIDVVIFDSMLVRSVPLGVPFERLYSASFQEIRNWTQKSLPWEKVTVTTGQYRDSLLMVGVIKSNLDSFIFTDDACYNEFGKLTSIVSGEPFNLVDEEGNPIKENKFHYLSGAGFLKWIIDGIVEPATGWGTKITDLTEPTVSFDAIGKVGVLSQDWNLTFTLDWCRNLASQAYSARYHRNVNFITAGLDVNKNYFAAEMIDGNLINSAGYLKNTGYSVNKIKSMLYILGITEPSWFYVAAIRQSSRLKPDELVFNNCAILFPYFDNQGKFGCFIFEQGKEISLDKFIENYKDSYIHLERVKSTETFFPYEKK